MYVEMATEEDRKIFENWRAEAKGIFLFVRHYLLLVLPTLQLIGHRRVYSLLPLQR